MELQNYGTATAQDYDEGCKNSVDEKDNATLNIALKRRAINDLTAPQPPSALVTTHKIRCRR